MQTLRGLKMTGETISKFVKGRQLQKKGDFSGSANQKVQAKQHSGMLVIKLNQMCFLCYLGSIHIYSASSSLQKTRHVMLLNACCKTWKKHISCFALYGLPKSKNL